MNFQYIKQVQSKGPYYLTGYSFGAAVAFEMAAQLESNGDKVCLILLDGSPGFVVRHTELYKSTRDINKFPLVTYIGAHLRFVIIFKDVDLLKVRLRKSNLKIFISFEGMLH